MEQPSEMIGGTTSGDSPFAALLAEVEAIPVRVGSLGEQVWSKGLAEPLVVSSIQDERADLSSTEEIQTVTSSRPSGSDSLDSLDGFLVAMGGDDEEEVAHYTKRLLVTNDSPTVEDEAVAASATESLRQIDKRKEAVRLWEGFKEAGAIDRTPQGVEVNMIALLQRLRDLRSRYLELQDHVDAKATLGVDELTELQEVRSELRFGTNFMSSVHESLLTQIFELPPTDMMTDEEFEAFKALSWYLRFDDIDSDGVISSFQWMKDAIAHDKNLPDAVREGKVHSLSGLNLPWGFMSTRQLDYSRFKKYYEQEVLGRTQYFYRDGDRVVHSRYGLVQITKGSEGLAAAVQQERDEMESLWWGGSEAYDVKNITRAPKSISRPIHEEERVNTIREQSYTEAELANSLQRGLKETPRDVLKRLKVHRVSRGTFPSGEGIELELIRKIQLEKDPANMPPSGYSSRDTNLADFIDESALVLGNAHVQQLAQEIAIISMGEDLRPGEKFALLIPPNYNVREIHALFPDIPVVSSLTSEGFARSLVDAYVELLQEDDTAAKKDNQPYNIFTPSENTLTDGSGRHFAFASRHRGIIGLTSSVDAKNPAFQAQTAEIAGVAYLENMLRDVGSLANAQQHMRQAKRRASLKSLLKGHIPDATAIQVISDGDNNRIAVINRYGNQVVYQVTPDGEVVLLTPPGDKRSLLSPLRQVEIVQPIQKGSILIVSPGEIPPAIWASAAKQKHGIAEAIVDFGVEMAQKFLNRQQLTAIAMEVK